MSPSNTVNTYETEKAGVFKFLQVEERFWKPPFSGRISVDGRA